MDEIDYGLYRLNDKCRDEYAGLQNHEIAERLKIHKSTVTRHLRKLRRNIIKEKKFHRVSKSIKSEFHSIAFDQKYLRLNIYLYRFFKTPEQCLLIQYLWDEYYQKKKKIDKKEIYSVLPMSRKHIFNSLKEWEQQEIIIIENSMIDFNADLKRVLQQFI